MNYSFFITCVGYGKQEDCELAYKMTDINVYDCKDFSEYREEADLEYNYLISFAPNEMNIEKFMGFLSKNKEWFAKLKDKYIDICVYHDGFCTLDYTSEFLSLLGEMNINFLISCDDRKPVE